MNNTPEPSLEPNDPAVIGYCFSCGEEIYENEHWFSVDEGKVHGPNCDCLFYYLKETCSVKLIAELMHIPLE